MAMNMSVTSAFVICAAVLHGVAQPSVPAPQPLEAIEDLDSYAIYATVLQRALKDHTDSLLLQQETEGLTGCTGFLPRLTGEWADVAADFERQNARERMLKPVLPMNIQYRLIRRSEIQADDARLAQKYPGLWQRRPGSLEYAAVSTFAPGCKVVSFGWN